MGSEIVGIVHAVEPKTSKKGKDYYRIQIDSTWLTGFGVAPVGFENQRARALMRALPSGDEVVDQIVFAEASQPGAAPAPGPGSVATGWIPHKDLWICTESIFQHWLAKVEKEPDTETVEHMALESARLALIIDACFLVRAKLGFDDAIKAINKHTPGSPSRVAAEMQDRAMQRSQDQVSGDFDDDIPF